MFTIFRITIRDHKKALQNAGKMVNTRDTWHVKTAKNLSSSGLFITVVWVLSQEEDS